MTSVPTARTASPELPLKYVGGDPSVDLVNTVDWLHDGLAHDRIPDYGRFVEWAEGAGVITRPTADRLRRTAASHPRQAASALGAAASLRWLLQRLFADVASGTPSSAALEEFNELLAVTLGRMRVAAVPRRGLAIAWDGMGDDLQSPLWPVIWSAAQLLASADADRLRVCDAPECGWMYVDRSRNGLRRWCQMETCGTREKNRRRAAGGRRVKGGSR
jgi:predicted RNA-binding Zn ribbon-like protein